ncbi:Cysteine and histidine-rich domain-containing protein 1 CHORD domain-containing protein 1 [Trichostrongylus colubriformis]|uniref:Cysteine and histidine-rich domain-containing protein 1 CHORD domain-containing protein 1 n=1 Tax=Trichostrongylus colubriformis TaxID=6319 RepID=A0AAN8IQU4_TRICO
MPAKGSSSEDNLIQCYNKGCGQKFDPQDNNTESCLYHPGPPYFHDAYKIWNCCNKKSTDFGTWLNFPGCTRGKHNGEKPADIVKVAAVKEIRPEKEEDVIVWKGLNKPAERKAEEEREEVALKMDVTPGAQAALQRYREQQGNNPTSNELRIGAPCRNNACDKSYSGPESDATPCIHHPGRAIFHEGMKYWSCCEKKTSNFNAFLAQVGCEKGKHQWSANEKVENIRDDWFSSNGTVTINVYCKGAVPDDVRVTSDGQMLRLHVVHGFGKKETDLIYDLWGEIVCSESRVVVGERKVEIIMKQKDVAGWPRLRYDPALDGRESMEEVVTE